MKFSYRITKYHNLQDDGTLTSPPDEWTSYYDIDKKVSIEEYKKTEDQYIDVIRSLAILTATTSLTITQLEIIEPYTTHGNNEELCIEESLAVAREALQEKIWCKLISTNLEIHFGRDYYMYALCKSSPQKLRRHIKTTLHIEEFASPYI